MAFSASARLLYAPAMTFRPSLIFLLLAGCATGEPLKLNGSTSGLGGAEPSAGSDSAGATGTGAAGAAGGSGGAGLGAEGGGGMSVQPSCGDGTIDAGEECDDQNGQSGDGCAACMIECAPSELKDPLSGHCYKLFVVSSAQSAAEANCQTWGGAPGLGHLASLSSAAENVLVGGLITDNTWIGADDLGGSWAWLDGSAFAYENWQNGEPNFPGIEHCMFADAADKWHDHNCADLRPAYLCERGSGN